MTRPTVRPLLTLAVLTLALAPGAQAQRGWTEPSRRFEALDRHLKDRKTNAGDVAKVGTQRAVETQDRDVVVPAGSRVELRLEGGLTI